MAYLKTMWMKLPEAVRWGLALYLVARVLLLTWANLIMMALPFEPAGSFYNPVVPLPSGQLGFLTPLMRWDVYWFTRIAAEGYGVPDGRGAFSPLYPLLIRLLGDMLSGQYFLAALIISDLACLGSLIMLYDFAQREFNAGRGALIMLLMYPFAFFLFVPYSDGLLLLLILVSYRAANRDRWWLAGSVGALAVLTKITALSLLLAYAWLLWTRRRNVALWNGLWLMLFLVAMVGWIGLRQIWMDTTALFSSSSPYGMLAPLLSPDFHTAWQEPLSTPWGSLLDALAAPFRNWATHDIVSSIVDVFMIVFLIYATFLTARLAQRAYFVYVAATLLMNLMIVSAHVPLLDAPRRMLSAFPVFIALSLYLPHRARRWLVIPAVLMQMLLSAMYVKWVLIG